MTPFPQCSRFFALLLVLLLSSTVSFARTTKKRTPNKNADASATRARTAASGKKSAQLNKSSSQKIVKTRGKSRTRRGRSVASRFVTGGPWSEPTFADSTIGDNVDGEDPTVRRAAVEALGPYNGTVVVADPQTGRVLTIVNQKLAFKDGFQPCSTVKIYAALAGLNEGIIDRDTNVR